MKEKLIERKDYYEVVNHKVSKEYKGYLFIYDEEFEKHFFYTRRYRLNSWLRILAKRNL